MERRANERHRVWFPMTVVTEDGGEGTAITFDVSSTGVLMACPGELAVGSKVTLRFTLSTEDEERVLAGTVRRTELNPEGDARWRHRLAVEFDDPHPELESLIEAEARADDEP